MASCPRARPARWSSLQQEIAAERGAASGLARLIWLPPGLAVEDERQRRFIEHLRTASSVHAGCRAAGDPAGGFEDVDLPPARPLRRGAKKRGSGGLGEDSTARLSGLRSADLEAVRPLEDLPVRSGLRGRAPAVRRGRGAGAPGSRGEPVRLRRRPPLLRRGGGALAAPQAARDPEERRPRPREAAARPRHLRRATRRRRRRSGSAPWKPLVLREPAGGFSAGGARSVPRRDRARAR